MTRKRRRLVFCVRCNRKTLPSAEDAGRCSSEGCFSPYHARRETKVIPFPLRVVRRVDDDDYPPDAA